MDIPKPWKGKQSLSQIVQRSGLPVLVMHYSRSRKHARIESVTDDGDYVGYYLSTPEYSEQWKGDAIEWILLATLRR
jgi:hypothetical protein